MNNFFYLHLRANLRFSFSVITLSISCFTSLHIPSPRLLLRFFITNYEYDANKFLISNAFYISFSCTCMQLVTERLRMIILGSYPDTFIVFFVEKFQFVKKWFAPRWNFATYSKFLRSTCSNVNLQLLKLRCNKREENYIRLWLNLLYPRHLY